VAGTEKGLAVGLAEAAELPGVADVRVLGAVGVVQTRTPVDVTRAPAAALAAGVWLRPFRDLVCAMPPYVSTGDDVGYDSPRRREALAASLAGEGRRGGRGATDRGSAPSAAGQRGRENRHR
jgi:adenosylmethionine-8-amino-7-oxononanoate aminotransferase